MIHKIYTVRDNKAESYLPPFYSQSKGTAIRSFSESCNDPNSMFCKYPDDFALFEIGTFDDSSCSFETHSPVNLGLAREFKKYVELPESSLPIES
jgi:hypothetical protein